MRLFDVRAYEKGPFSTFSPELGGSKGFTGIKFSNDGKLMLLSTNQGMVVLLDAFKGEVLQIFVGHSNEHGMALEACFTPDAAFVLSGSEDGGIWRWETATGKASAVLREHAFPVSAIKCNPTRMMLASACSSLSLWLPPP